jgi:hypothetical protein
MEICGDTTLDEIVGKNEESKVQTLIEEKKKTNL